MRTARSLSPWRNDAPGRRRRETSYLNEMPATAGAGDLGSRVCHSPAVILSQRLREVTGRSAVTKKDSDERIYPAILALHLC
jgi:hypothetical protein